MKPCLHCTMIKAIQTFVKRQNIDEGGAAMVAGALSAVMGDLLGNHFNQEDWEEALALFNVEALRRAVDTKKENRK